MSLNNGLKNMGSLTGSLFSGNTLEDFISGATVVFHERIDPPFEEQEKIAEVVGKERGETLAEGSGSIEKVEKTATNKLVDEGFVPFSHRRGWNLRTAEEKFQIIHPFVQLVHDKIQGTQPYTVQEYADAIPSKPVRSRGRTLLYLGIGAAILGAVSLGALYINDQNQKKDQRYQQLTSKAKMSRERAIDFDNKYNGLAVDNVYPENALNFAGVYGIDPSLAEHGYQRWVLRPGGSLSSIPTAKLFGINSTLLPEIYRNSKQNSTLTEETSELCLDFVSKIQRFSQIYTLTNATDYFGSSTALKSEIGSEALLSAIRTLGENDGINRDFNNSRKHANLLRLAKYVSNILKYPKDWREGAIQVDDIIYGYNLANGKSDTGIWESIVKPAIKYIIDKYDKGEIVEIDIPEDRYLEAQSRRNLLLPSELFSVDILTGNTTGISRDTARHNVNPNESIGGKSPQEWLDDMAKKDLREKTLRYQLAIMEAREGHPAYGEWPKSNEAYLSIFDSVLGEDEIAVFIQGYPRSLASGFDNPKIDPIVPMSGQTTPSYSVLVGRCFGRPVIFVGDKYPNSAGNHGEAFVYSPKTYSKLSQHGTCLLPRMFGWWQYKEELREDHEKALYAPDVRMKTADAKSKEIKLD